MISINATLFIQVIHFLILVFILNRLMFRPILKVIDERHQYIDGIKKETIKVEEETSELLNKCIAMEESTRKDTRNENSRLKMDAITVTEKIFSDTKEEITVIRDKINKEVDEQLKSAKQTLHSEAAILANDIMVKVIGRGIGN
ncbi:hypothetical protein ACFL0H_01705 [Thermodesulfobacteriota bacterium]